MNEIKYLSVSEFATIHNMDSGNVRHLIKGGKIPAVKIGNQWAIPADTPKPPDRRVRSGKYKNWRNKDENADISE